MLRYEQEAWSGGYRILAGVDEAGRGPWAGPVFACAVILPLPRGAGIPDSLEGLTDSKRLTSACRRRFVDRLRALPGIQIGVGHCLPSEIDALNILQASLTAMVRALSGLARVPDLVLVDGNRVPPAWPGPARAIVGGDGLSLSIAAASVVAKTLQEDAMDRLDADFPDYGFIRHRGYGTPEHAAALRRFGPTPHHRFSFRPVRDAASPDLFSYRVSASGV